MSKKIATRRHFLKAAGMLALAAPVLQACSQPTPSTEAPAGQKTAPPKEEGTSKPTAAPKPQAGPPQGNASLSIAVWTDAVRTWQNDSAEEYAKAHPEVVLKIEQVPYDEMAKKQLAGVATGTLQDLVFSGVKWFAYSAYKGAFKALDDYVKTNDPGMDDFFEGAISNSKLDGKLYSLPFEVNTGNTNIVIYNKNLLDEKGVKEPTDEWSVEEFASAAGKITDKEKKTFGTNYLTTNYYDFATLARSYGGDIFDSEAKKFTFATDPKSVEAAQWKVDLRLKHNGAPLRAEAQGLQFAAGQIGFNCTGIYSIKGMGQTIGDKFKWDVVLGPTGPGGLRGYEVFTTMYSMYSKSKNPDAAYDLLVHMTSKDTAMVAFVEQGQPPARKSIWMSPEAEKESPVWKRAAEWLSDGKNKGPFPMPYNLRFSELQDKFGNLVQTLWYGEVDFQEGLQKVQDECQKIMDLPRG